MADISLSGEIFWCLVLVFWELWVFFPPSLLLYEHIPILIQRGPAPKAEKDVEPCVFHCAYARNEYVLLFTFRWIYSLALQFRYSTTSPTRYTSFTFFLFGSNSNIVFSKASSCPCSSSQRWISRGYNTLCLLIHYLISHLIVFRLTYFPGWLALH